MTGSNKDGLKGLVKNQQGYCPIKSTPASIPASTTSTPTAKNPCIPTSKRQNLLDKPLFPVVDSPRTYVLSSPSGGVVRDLLAIRGLTNPAKCA